MLRYLLIGLTLALFISGEVTAMAKRAKPAHFQHGTTTIVKSFNINSEGGSLEIKDTDTPIDGTTIYIPAEATDKEVTISIGFNDGKLNLRSGRGSDITLVLKSEKPITFKKHITITLRYDTSVNPKWIIGYEIDGQGRLHTVDTGEMNRENGTVSFYSFKPLFLTWAYIEND